MDEIELRLREILKDIVSDDEERVQIINDKSNIDLVKDLEFDSITIFEYIVSVDDEFHVMLENEEDMIDIIWDYGRMLEWLRKNTRTVLP